MTKTSDPTYASLETAALADLAARTLCDPDAPAEHVQAARVRLTARPFDAARLTANVPTADAIELIRALEKYLAPHLGKT